MSDNTTATQRPRTLVLCFDGTDNEYDSNNTNVVKFFSLLKKDDFDVQLCYYQAGIGTFFAPGVVSPFFQWCAKVLDEAVAWYLDAHVMDGYKFLMDNYRVGDKICLFGFSRGAYTARALGGMLYKVGLLPRDNPEQVPFAYKMYKKGDTQLSGGFKQTFCQHVEVEFMGMWDTVASVGVIMARTLPFINSNSAVKTFRHALSLDEHRAKFRPNLFHQPEPGSASTSEKHGDEKHPGGCFGGTFFSKEKNTIRAEVTTNVQEVWFSGCHSDVGGGDVPNTASNSLANISLRWMVHQVMDSTCGVIFNEDALVALSIPLVTTPVPDSSDDPNSIENLDKGDAVQPLHDELKINPLWWILEVFPFQFKYQNLKGVWKTTHRPNLGKGRKIINPKPQFHITVKERIDDSKLGYTPNARWKAGSQVYVK